MSPLVREHRLWQQYRYRLPQAASSLDLRARLEERYFDHNGKAGARSRFSVQWSKPLAAGFTLSLGNELVVNLNDIGSIRRGFSQYRLLSGLQREIGGGNQIDFNYQLRYVHSPGAGNFLQHQVQLHFLHRL